MKFIVTILTIGLISLSLTEDGQAQNASIQVTDGPLIEVVILNISERSVRFKAPTKSAISELPFSKVDNILFKPTKEWYNAESAFRSGQYKVAGKLYSEVAADRAANYYPAPGNFSSLALTRMVECHRRLVNPKPIAGLVKQIEAVKSTLPKSKRELSVENQAWVAASQSNWAKVAELTKDGLAARNIELSYLAGVANRSLGNSDIALDGFTNAYSLGFAAYPAIAKVSLKQAAEILASLADEERDPELQAQLKLYFELYGQGSLWKDAPPSYLKLATGKLTTLNSVSQAVDIKVPSLPDDLPPQSERDWYLIGEVDTVAYVVGAGEFEPAGEGPEKVDKHLVFNGKSMLIKKNIDIDLPITRIQAAIIPESSDGVILIAGKGSRGFALFLKKGQLFLSWKLDKESPKQYPLGAAPVGVQTRIGITISANGAIKGSVSPQGYKQFGVLPGLMDIGDKSSIRIGPVGSSGSPVGEGLPRFTGIVQHISMGFERTMVNYFHKEEEMFDGKRIVLMPKAVKKK